MSTSNTAPKSVRTAFAWLGIILIAVAGWLLHPSLGLVFLGIGIVFSGLVIVTENEEEENAS